MDKNTLVFFTSDNGSPRSGGEIFNSSGALRGNKGSLNEGGLRVPMIVRWPDKIQAGNVSTAPWYFADVMPTLAEIAGAMPVANTDGISVLPTLLGQSQVLDERFLYWEIPPPKLRQAARMGPWKAVREEPNLPLRVFNVVDDVSEENDVASVQSELVAKFENYLKNARTDSPH